jgi:hypothetical protein
MLEMKKQLASLLLVLFSLDALVQCQQLTIQPEAGKQTVLSRADLEALPHTTVTAGASDAPATFVGVPLQAVLEKAGITFEKSLSGKRLASCLLVEAADGYQVVFALPEIDSAFNDKKIVLAFSKNGKPLDEKEGPYRIVIPDEKRMARWVRQVKTLRILEVH